MKKARRVLHYNFGRGFILVGLAVGFCSMPALASNPTTIPNRYLLKFKKNLTNSKIHKTTLSAQMATLQDSGLNVKKYVEEIQVFVVEAKNQSIFSIKNISKTPDILYIEPVYEVHAIATPSDDQFSSQTGLRRIAAEAAWDKAKGSKSIVVAVSDTGVDRTHRDLANQSWINSDEIAGNGIDDDANGYIDDVYGWDFSANDNDPMDDHSHGTHVAGIIGAEANNGGIVGVNWNTSIMAVKFLNARGSGTSEGGMNTFIYAANNGANVINASWGGGGFSNAVKDAIAYAVSKGSIVICAAGNDNNDTDKEIFYPAGYQIEGMVSVAASQSTGSLAGFSNYGATTVDLAAPGNKILSTVPDQKWLRFSGTSMASPMVAGAAALILSADPTLSVLDLRNAIFNATDEQKGYSKKTATSGELNLKKAVEQLSGPFQVWPDRIRLTKSASFQFTARNYKGGSVSFKSSDPKVASISANGLLQAKKSGTVKISATDGTGASVSNDWVTIGTEEPPAGGGCNKNKNKKMTQFETANAVVNFSMPLLAGFLFVPGLSVFRRKK